MIDQLQFVSVSMPEIFDMGLASLLHVTACFDEKRSVTQQVIRI